MALTKAQRIEIQEAAKFNYHKRLREQEDKKLLQEQIAKKIAEETKPAKVEPTRSTKKGK